MKTLSFTVHTPGANLGWITYVSRDLRTYFELSCQQVPCENPDVQSLLKKLEIRAVLSPTFHVPRGDSQLVVSLAGLGGGPAVHSRHPAPAYRLPRHLPDPVVTYIRFDVKNFFHPEMIY